MTGTVVASAAAVPCSSADVQDVTTRLTKIVAQKEQEWKEVYTLNMLSLQAALQSVEDKVSQSFSLFLHPLSDPPPFPPLFLVPLC